MVASNGRDVGQDGHPGRRHLVAGCQIEQRGTAQDQRHDGVAIPDLERHPLALGLALGRIEGRERPVDVAALDGSKIRPSDPLRGPLARFNERPDTCHHGRQGQQQDGKAQSAHA